jgi:excisionase family DNA binding protein
MTEQSQSSLNLVTAQEAATRLRVSPAMVYKLSHLGQLPFIRIGRRIGILESDLDKFFEINRYPQSRVFINVG